MNIKNMILVFLGFLLISATGAALTQENATQDTTTQKVVLLQGAYTRLMNGDPLLYEISKDKARYQFNENEVLPYLLKTGWRIVSLEISEKSRLDKPYGYAILERVSQNGKFTQE